MNFNRWPTLQLYVFCINPIHAESWLEAISKFKPWIPVSTLWLLFSMYTAPVQHKISKKLKWFSFGGHFVLCEGENRDFVKIRRPITLVKIKFSTLNVLWVCFQINLMRSTKKNTILFLVPEAWVSEFSPFWRGRWRILVKNSNFDQSMTNILKFLLQFGMLLCSLKTKKIELIFLKMSYTQKNNLNFFFD